MRFGKLVASIQLYFILCLFYFMFGSINETVLNKTGIIFYHILFYLSPVFIIGSLVYFIVTKKVDYKREYIYIIPALLLTIMFFEFFLKK